MNLSPEEYDYDPETKTFHPKADVVEQRRKENPEDFNAKEEAGKAQEEMKGELKSTRTEYAPKSNVAPDNPHWDGNRYGI